MADQDKNSANDGDLLKHCLLADVLDACSQEWEHVNFSETHAGAGTYKGDSQSPPRDYISRLRTLVKSKSVDKNDLAFRYWKLLHDWWSKDENKTTYPGSSLQAALLLHQRLESGRSNLCVTECDAEIHNRLSAALSPFQNGVETIQDGFQNQIDRLLQRDNLVVLIDPFGYAFDDSGVSEGGLNLQRLLQLLEPCFRKKACVIGFWCATTQDGSTQLLRRLFSLTLLLYIAKYGAAYRRFAFKAYTIEWLGIGEGKSIVNGLPSGDWKKSWLEIGLRDQPSSFSVFAANRTVDNGLVFKDFYE